MIFIPSCANGDLKVTHLNNAKKLVYILMAIQIFTFILYLYVGPIYEKMSKQDLYIFFYPKIINYLLSFLGFLFFLRGKFKIGLLLLVISDFGIIIILSFIRGFRWNLIIECYDVILIFLVFIFSKLYRKKNLSTQS